MTGKLATIRLRKSIPARWTDPILAALFVLACETETLVDLHSDTSHHHWPLAANVLIVAGLSVPIAWRRRAPLACASIVMLCVFALTVSVKTPAAVGVPLRIPLEEPRLNPAGSVPLVTAHVIGAVPPAIRVCE